jgi:hypothetical protein
VAGRPVITFNEETGEVIVHEFGPLPAADAAVVLSRALALLLAQAAEKSKSPSIQRVPSLVTPT